MAGRKIEVQIIGDASSLKRAFGDAADHGSRFGSALGGLAKAGVVAAGAAGIGALFVTLKAGISEFTQSTKVAAQTEAVIKSTGGTANVTAKHVDELAKSIMNYSGIDDEAIKSGENMLLTFKGIRNEVGKGNDIFDQSTKILTDMSVALGGDASKNAIRLGKALNDPIKGVTALTKVGVSFNDGQKATIKSLVESGHTMEAQKLILKELNSEFGGSAKAIGDTLPGQINKLKENFNNLAGDLVAKAVPALTTFTGFLAEKGMPAMEHLFGVIGEKAGPAIEGLVNAFKDAGPGIMAFLTPLGETIGNVIVPIFQQLAAIGASAIQAIGNVLRENGPQIRTIFSNIGEVIKNLAAVIIPILKFAFTVVLPVAIRILIPILELLTGALKMISSVVKAVATAVASAFTAIVGAVRGAVGGAIAAATAVGTGIRDGVMKVVNTIDSKVRAGFSAVWGAIKGLAGMALSAGREIGEAIVRGIINGLTGLAGKAAGVVRDAISHLPHISIPGFSPIEHVGQHIGELITSGMARGVREGNPNFHRELINGIRTAKAGADDWIDSVGVANMAAEGGKMAAALNDGFRVNSIVAPSGSAALGGTPLANSGQQAPTVVVHVEGSVVTEKQLIDAIHDGLLHKQRQNGTLGWAV
jgi:phage-related protein